jgi:hypothetical protein
VPEPAICREHWLSNCHWIAVSALDAPLKHSCGLEPPAQVQNSIVYMAGMTYTLGQVQVAAVSCGLPNTV